MYNYFFKHVLRMCNEHIQISFEGCFMTPGKDCTSFQFVERTCLEPVVGKEKISEYAARKDRNILFSKQIKEILKWLPFFFFFFIHFIII